MTFWREKKEPTPRKDPNEAAKKMIEELREWKAIGDTFEYLGRTCVVTEHGTWRHIGFGEFYLVPDISFDYADNNGVIHARSMTYGEAMALKASEDQI